MNGYHFRRQQVVHGFVADFYCQAAALIVELDGEAHAGREGYDAERDRILSGLGFLIVRFDNEAVCGQTDGVLKAISELSPSELQLTK